MKRPYLASFALLLILVSGFLIFGAKGVSAADSASLYLSPGCGPVYNGRQVTLDIHVNSGTTPINAVQADLNYQTSQFSVVSVTVASGWSQAQNDTSTPGTILFAAFPSSAPFTSTGDKVIATVIFQAVTNTSTAGVSFANSSAVLRASDSTDILTRKVGGNYPQRLSHLCGSLVKTPNNPQVYLIADGSKRPINTPAIFVSQGFNWNWISYMTTADQELPTGSPVTFRDGSLIKGASGSALYVTDNSSGSTQKRRIATPAVYSSLGYTGQDIITVPDGQLPPDGTPITSAASHPNGTLVTPGSGIYLIDNGKKRYIGSVYILYTHGYNYYQIKPATSADWALPSGENMYMRDGMLLKGSDQKIYAIDSKSGTGVKHHIPTMNTFVGLGYHFGSVINVPDGVLPPTTGSSL